METSTNLQIVQQLFTYFGSGNIPAFMSLLSPDISWTEPGDADIPYAGTFTGLAGIGQMLGIISKSLHMKTFTPNTFCTNDNVVTVLGCNEAEVIPTGKCYTTDWVYAFTLADGKVTKAQVYMDTLTIAKAFKA